MKKALIGLSGGVDSAVAAWKLCSEGYDVTGCYLCLTENSSPDSDDALSAKQTAEKLGIDFVTFDARERFRKKVTDAFSAEYLSGRTPNPCVSCNPEVKIFSLIEQADRLGAEHIATGHYARTIAAEDGRFIAASPSKKDQSYFLYALKDSQIKRLLFPLGDYLTKDEIRAKARELGFEAAEKPDSLDICFIPDGDYARFICKSTGYVPESGSFLSDDGKVIGTHSGIINYTVGQRKGLGAFGEPMYVKRINAADNTVTLCTAAQRFASEITARQVIVHGGSGTLPSRAFVKIRSTAKAQPAALFTDGDSFKAVFDSPVTAPTPGQSAVIYSEDGAVLGGGIII